MSGIPLSDDTIVWARHTNDQTEGSVDWYHVGTPEVPRKVLGQFWWSFGGGK